MISDAFKKVRDLFKPQYDKKSLMEILPDDVFLVSYPKSGNTWMRFLIGNYISDHKVDFTNSHLVVPDLHFNPEYCKEIHARPRFIKSHMPYTSKYPRVIYIVRDGRDVAVSYYYYRLKRGDLSKEETSFSEYLKDFYLEGIPLFGTWSQNVASWLDRMKDGNILLLKYEDVLKDTETELVKALEFAGLDIEKKRLERAIEESSFPRMQELEVRQHNECPTLGKELENKDILFVREGRSGGWKNYFSIEDEKAFYKYNNSVMDKLGYI